MPETTETGYEVPTIPELIARIEAAFLTHLEGENAEAVKIKLTWEWAAVRVIAGLAYLLYRYGAHIAAQAIYDRAAVPVLKRWARMWGVEPLTAEKATGLITFTGDDGSEIPEGTVLQRKADGWEVATTAGGFIASGTLNLAVKALETGEEGNDESGTVYELVSPLDGVSGTATVEAAGLSGGRDDETAVRLLERLLERIQGTPQGGADDDYVLWSRQIADVDQVWVYSNEPAPGDVTIRLTVEEGTGTGTSERIPSAGKLAEVLAHITASNRKPSTATPYVLAPTEAVVDMSIDLYPKPNEPDTRTAVEAELKSLLKRRGRPAGAGATLTIENSRFRTAIGNAKGEDYHSLTDLDGDGDGQSNLVTTVGELPVLGTITWGL